MKQVPGRLCRHEYGVNWVWFYPINGSPSFRLHKDDKDINSYLANSTERPCSSKTDSGSELWKARIRLLNMQIEQQQLQIDQLVADVKKLKARKPRKQKEVKS